jgi:hypothetical protein
MTWMIFFFVFGLLHLIFSVLMGLGAPGVAGGGLFMMLKMFAGGTYMK